MNAVPSRCVPTVSWIAVGLAWVLVGASPSAAAPAHLWFSLSAEDPLQYTQCGATSDAPRAPIVNLPPQATETLYLWARPEEHQSSLLSLHNLSLNLRAHPDVDVQSFVFHNPDNRFATVVDSANPSPLITQVDGTMVTYPNPVDDGLERLSAFTVTPTARVGIGATTPGPLSTQQGPAWLLATVVFQTQANSGRVGARLEVGHASITHFNPNDPIGLTNPAPITSIRFGDATDAVYNAASDRQTSISGDTDDIFFQLGPLLPGDVNGDGKVDLLDLDILGRNYNDTPATRCQGDLTGDNKVDLLDLDELGQHFGTGGSVSIPEPVSLPAVALVAGMLVCALGPRRPAGFAAVLACCCLAAQSAEAAQLNADWLGGPGFWNNAGNWSTANFPNNGLDTYVVTIDAPSSTVILNTMATIDSLTLDASTSFLGVTNQLDVLGAAQVDSGTLIVDGTLTATSVQNTGGLIAGGGQLLLPGGTLTNDAAIRPGGASIVDLLMEGDYSQTSTGVYEAQITGLTPATQHDVFAVVGDATLAGRIDLPITQGVGFPLPNDSVTVLSSDNRMGEFDSYRVTGLPANVAQQLAYNGVDVRVNFVNTSSTALEDLGGVPALWSVEDTWTDGVPDSTSIVTIQSTVIGQSETVRVLPPGGGPINAAHEINLSGGLGDVTLSVEGAPLSVSTVTSIGNGATVSLTGAAQLSSETVAVSNGGVLAGGGTIVSDVEVGLLAGSQAVFDPVGLFDIEGNYAQGLDGLFAAEIAAAPFNAANDTLSVAGDIDLSGSLEIDVSGLLDSEFTLGDTYELIRYEGALTGTFDTINVLGRNDLFFTIDYQGTSTEDDLSAVLLTVNCGANGRTGDVGTAGLDGFDAAAFAAALLDNDLLRFEDPDQFPREAVSWPYTLYFDFDATTPGSAGVVDFYDVPHFVNCYAKQNNLSLAEAYAVLEVAIARARNPVPEPGAATLLAAACVWFSPASRRRR